MQNLIVLLAMSGRKACPQMEPKMSDVFSTSISSVRRPARLLSILALSATLSACGTFNVENDYPEIANGHCAPVSNKPAGKEEVKKPIPFPLEVHFRTKHFYTTCSG